MISKRLKTKKIRQAGTRQKVNLVIGNIYKKMYTKFTLFDNNKNQHTFEKDDIKRF